MSIRINLNIAEESGVGSALPKSYANANASLAGDRENVDSYLQSSAAQDEPALFDWLKCAPLLLLFSQPPVKGIEETPLHDLYERALLISDIVKNKRNLGVSVYSEMRLEQLTVEIEILFRHFSKAISYLKQNTKTGDALAEREIEKASFTMESMVTEFSTAAKLLAISFGAESLNEASLKNGGLNVVNFSKAVMEFIIFVSNVTHSKNVYLLARETINDLISVLDTLVDAERLGALERLLAKYGEHFDSELVEKMLVLNAREKLATSQEAISEFIRERLISEGLPKEGVEAGMAMDRDNFERVLSGLKTPAGGSHLFNGGTPEKPVWMFHSVSLWRAIEIEPFYAKLLEGKKPLIETLPVLHAPVVRFKRPSAHNDDSLSHDLSEAFAGRNEDFMEGLARLRENLKEVGQNSRERFKKK